MALARGARTWMKGNLHTLFTVAQRFGMSVLPVHFYSSIPNVREMRGRVDWQEPRSMFGINSRSVEEQGAFLNEITRAAVPGEAIYAQAVADNGDGGYGPIEAHVLAALVASRRPRRIVQIGCGVSTAVILSAARLAGYRPEMTCIDPYPTRYLSRMNDSGAVMLLASPAQIASMKMFTDLGPGDLLFVNSTHTVKPGSEVNRIVLEILPRLAAGVLVHFHDIRFPYEYARDFLSGDLFFPGETTLLYAYLLENPTMRIDLCLSTLHYKAPAAIKAAIRYYDPQKNDAGLRAAGGLHYPSAIYLTKVAIHPDRLAYQTE